MFAKIEIVKIPNCVAVDTRSCRFLTAQFLPFANGGSGSILLKNSVFGGAQKIAGPQGLRSILDVGGRRDFVLRATKIVLTEPAAIRGSNSRLRLRLARNCGGCIFEFFNRIDPLRPLAAAPKQTLHDRRRAVAWRG